MSDCTGCHNGPDTDESGNAIPLAERYLAGGQNFGPVFSRNLTPDANGLPAGLTFEQFVRVIREGRDFKELPPIVGNPDTLIVMPWPSYRHGTDPGFERCTRTWNPFRACPGAPRKRRDALRGVGETVRGSEDRSSAGYGVRTRVCRLLFVVWSRRQARAGWGKRKA